MIIINSDDFAYSTEVNIATIKAFEQNLISSTTALMNFNEGLEDAVKYVQSGQIKAPQLGIHLNLTEGIPLTDAIKHNPRFCKNGKFVTSRKNAMFRMNDSDTFCTWQEFDAQLSLFREKFGFKPSHIDSHHHIHTEWAVMKCTVGLAKKHEINSIRLSRNIGDIQGFKKALYKRAFNHYLRLKGFKVTDFFGDISDTHFSGISNNKNYEIMVHALLDSGRTALVDLDRKNLHDKLFELFKTDTWILSTYDAL